MSTKVGAAYTYPDKKRHVGTHLLKEEEGLYIDRSGVTTAKSRRSQGERGLDSFELNKHVDAISDGVSSIIQANPTKADNAAFLTDVFNQLLKNIKILDSKIRSLRKGQPAMEVPDEFLDID
jgi:hypothetical protein